MKLRYVFLLTLALIVTVLFIIWELSLSFGFVQVIGAGMAIAAAAVVVKILTGGKHASGSDFIKAEKFAEDYVKFKTNADITYMESSGATRIFTDKEGNPIKFFAFAVPRFKGIRPIPFLVILSKEKYGGLDIFDKREHPSQSELDDFFGKNATWSIVIGNPKIAKLVGAPVSIREENFGKTPSTGQTINVGVTKSEDAEERKRLGL